MDFTVADIIRTQAAARPHRPALTYEGVTSTYGELDRRCSQVANALRGDGVQAGDRVAILAKNRPEYFEVLFGGGMINAVNVNVNWRLAPPEVEYIVNDAEARVLFVGPDFIRIAEEIEGYIVELGAGQVGVLDRLAGVEVLHDCAVVDHDRAREPERLGMRQRGAEAAAGARADRGRPR